MTALVPDPPEDWRRPVRRYGPLDKISVPSVFTVRLAGVSFHPSYPLSLTDLPPGSELVLRREPDNRHDANAIAVVVDGRTDVIGHVPAGLAARLAPAIDLGADYRVQDWQVEVAPGHEDRPGLSLTVVRAGGR